MTELDSNPKSIQALYAWYAEDKLWVNRRYQRKLVWTLEEKQKLVESVLRRYPIPAILLAEREQGGYEVIDGLQRLHTLMSFVETAFSDLRDQYFNVAEYPTANTRASERKFVPLETASRLTAREVGTYLDYSMAVSIMRGASDAEVDEVFSRINTYGHRLSDQERRQAGVQNDFSQMVRQLSSFVRGDVTDPVLRLVDMPSVSIDMPKTRHGYSVEASTIFWVEHGIIRASGLRDSMDEQCVADVAASIVGGQIIPRSKEALDDVYREDSAESARVDVALATYGIDKFSAEFKYVLDEIRKVSASGTPSRLGSLLFSREALNQFPAVFAVLFIAFHELLISEGRRIPDYVEVRDALDGLDTRMNTSRGSISPQQRRKNINLVKGLVLPHLVAAEHRDLYDNRTAYDIDEAVLRSEIEAPHYELKQGVLRLDNQRTLDVEVLQKLIRTVCAIANNGRRRSGSILIGVADKESDADRVRDLYGITPRRVGHRWVVGVRREAEALGESVEDYFQRFRRTFEESTLSSTLKAGVLASLTYTDYFGLGVIVVNVPEQSGPSSVGDTVFARSGDQTVEVMGSGIFDVAARF